VKAMIIALFKVGNVKTTSVIPKLIDVGRSHFVGIVPRSSIKVSIYLLIGILIFSNNKKFDI
jgi:hypothetical protein